ncbi:extracellular solute-binding protein [Streptomyces minutiscleroticus]|uniref:ABC transporter substrate-binding protein n=1 Tax=Streptomyces minutiscleroticus TaxID=68238 RepID=A0A918KSB0_9ACTN|nr:extracellular solute-binding protein [Streptomyces minutiscleroticus]GGX73909.1 ABC transporter substrate-binding protein [Streptomyces minutiscleroticus]
MSRPRGLRHGAVPLVVLLLALVAAACTDGRLEGPARPTGSGGSGEVVLASGRDVTGEAGIRKQLIDAWNAEQQREGTGRWARLVELPGSADEQRSQLLGALQSGSARYDVVNLDVTWVPEFAAAGLIRPLPGDLVDDDVVPSVARTARWDGELYAVPFNSDVGLLYYRRDYLRKAGVDDTDPFGPDTDWRTVRELRNSLADASDRLPEAYEESWTTQLDEYEGRTVNAVEAFASVPGGGPFTDGEGRYTGTERTLEAGVAELRRRTDTAYTLSAAFRSDEAESVADFADGRTAFLRHWPYVYRSLHQSLTEDQVGVAPLPGRAVLGGQNLAVTRASAQSDAARDLIGFLTGRESERCLLDAGFAATRTSAYTDDDLTCGTATSNGATGSPGATVSPGASSSGSPPAAPASGERADRMPRDGRGRPAYARDVLLPALRDAVQRPRTPQYGAFTQTFTTTLGPLFGSTPPTDAELAARLDEALRRVLGD